MKLWETGTLALANFGIGVWAGIWVLVAAVIAYRARHGDRLTAASWMVAVAAFLAVQEDPGLLVWLASNSPATDRDGVLGIVHAHALGHMYGGAAFAAAGLVLAVWVAGTALRRGERWAWMALWMYWAIGAAVDIVEVLFIYPHGFPLGATPADGVRGFGWEELAAWVLIWGSGLLFCRGQLRPAERRTPMRRTQDRDPDVVTPTGIRS